MALKQKKSIVKIHGNNMRKLLTALVFPFGLTSVHAADIINSAIDAGNSKTLVTSIVLPLSLLVYEVVLRYACTSFVWSISLTSI